MFVGFKGGFGGVIGGPDFLANWQDCGLDVLGWVYGCSIAGLCCYGLFLSLDTRDGKVQIGIDGLVAGIADIRVVGGVESWGGRGGRV